MAAALGVRPILAPTDLAPTHLARGSRPAGLTSAFLGPPQGSRAVNKRHGGHPGQRTRRTHVVSAEYRDSRGGGAGFFTGFLVGGAVCGALAFAFAPQLSKVLLGENEDGTPRRLPKWLGEDDDLEVTRQKMNEKLAELNRAIDLASDEILGERVEEKLVPEGADSKALEME